MLKIYTHFQTKTAQKPYPFGVVHTYIPDLGEYPPPPGAPENHEVQFGQEAIFLPKNMCDDVTYKLEA